MAIPRWAGPEFFHWILQFHIFKLGYAGSEGEALFHWRSIKYYINESETELKWPVGDLNTVFKKVKKEIPMVASVIDRYDLFNKE